MAKSKRKPAYLNPTQIVQEFARSIPEVLNNYVDHKRMKVFLHKGLECVTCGIVADRLVLWYDYGWKQVPDTPMHRGLHIDLLAGNMLMTVDHIFPKSLGGRDTLENLQPMCSDCNNKKSAEFDFECEVCGDTDYRISKRGNAVCDGICFDYNLVHGHYPGKKDIFV